MGASDVLLTGVVVHWIFQFKDRFVKDHLELGVTRFGIEAVDRDRHVVVADSLVGLVDELSWVVFKAVLGVLPVNKLGSLALAGPAEVGRDTGLRGGQVVRGANLFF